MLTEDARVQKSINLLPNRLTLYKRSNSGRWQCRFKVKNSKWQRESTGEFEQDAATDKAFKLYYGAEERARSNLPTNTRRFKQVALHAVQRMQNELDANSGKVVFNDYIRVINKYLIPFFGNRAIDTITIKEVQLYNDWRDSTIAAEILERKRGAIKNRIKDYKRVLEELEKLNANPPTFRAKQSTINTHNSALNRVFDEAILHGWLTQSIKPSLLNKGSKSESRGTFELDEYRKLTDTLRSKWQTKTPSIEGQKIRQVLREYVLILANTGMRHGTEAENLRWRDVGYYTDPKTKERYFEFYPKGKTGQRGLIARDGVHKFLERLRDMDIEMNGVDLDKIIEQRSDKYLFRDVDGNRVRANQLRQAFRKLLEDRDLRIGVDGKVRSLYSLRHMYATRALLKGQDIYLLSVQMGTSVKMLEMHYSKLKARMRAEVLSGRVRKIEQSEES